MWDKFDQQAPNQTWQELPFGLNTDSVQRSDELDLTLLNWPENSCAPSVQKTVIVQS